MSKPSFALSPVPSWITLTFVMSGLSLHLLLFALELSESAGSAGRFWMLMAGIAWSWWVFISRRRHGQAFAYEFEALVFFAWLVVVPWYLVKSRGVLRGPSAWAAWCLYGLPLVTELGVHAALS